ncbi:MAG TPA: flagellar hook-basal body complex protein FliE [Bryobacteraceae bacterium]|nr:flagellar hook-basal body complex protein FliE [Bryobacteraceae bacterium]
MPVPISPIAAPASVDSISRTIQAPGGRGAPGEFRGVLEGAINSVEQQGNLAAQSVERFLSGDGEELHTAMMATQRADLAFELGLQVRNKVVQAYQQIMQMQM